jgi:hypothetical protein
MAFLWAQGDIGKCVEWGGTRDRNGYGVVGWNRKLLMAHRASYIVAYGFIPPGLHIDHLCRNKACINPMHLEAVTQAENNARARAAAGGAVIARGSRHAR